MGSDLCTVLAWLRACRPVPAQSSELGPHCGKQVAPLVPCRESADAQRREPPAQHGVLPVGLKNLAWIQLLSCVTEQSGHAQLSQQTGQETTSCAATVHSSRARASSTNDAAQRQCCLQVARIRGQVAASQLYHLHNLTLQCKHFCRACHDAGDIPALAGAPAAGGSRPVRHHRVEKQGLSMLCWQARVHWQECAGPAYARE